MFVLASTGQVCAICVNNCDCYSCISIDKHHQIDAIRRMQEYPTVCFAITNGSSTSVDQLSDGSNRLMKYS